MISNGNNVGDYRGGSDEYPTKHHKTASRMEGTATRLGWDIPDKYKEGIIADQHAIATDPDNSPRERTSAARAIISANAQNVAIAISPSIQEETNEVQPVPVEQLLAMRRATAPGG